MVGLQAICGTLADFAPLRLAESWDNVGLLVGDRSASARRVMTCLTVTPPVVEEAIAEKVDLIVTHHPLPFKGLQKITSDSPAGSMLLQLIRAGTAIYSAHTAFDSARHGINESWAQLLQLASIEPLIGLDVADARSTDTDIGSGRFGQLPSPTSLDNLAIQAGALAGTETVRVVGCKGQDVTRVAVACGSGGGFLSAAKRHGCDAMITGEATFHTCLEAEAVDIGLVLLGHYASERFAMERLSAKLSEVHPKLTIWPSRAECDPLRTLTV